MIRNPLKEVYLIQKKITAALYWVYEAFKCSDSAQNRKEILQLVLKSWKILSEDYFYEMNSF